MICDINLSDSIMKRLLFSLSSLLLAAVMVVGCDQVALDEPEPQQSIQSERVFTTQEGFEATLNAAYDRLESFTRYGQYYQLYPDALSDNIDFIQGANRYNDIVRNIEDEHLETYNNPYDAINLTNNVVTKIRGLDLEAENPTAVKDRIKGEAHFLRALNYFDLVRTFAYEPGRESGNFTQGVVLRTQPTETVDDADFRPRASNQEVYDQVVADLDSAAVLLEGKAQTRSRANVAAAYGLLARAHLYLENWAEAEAAATEAINRAGAVDASLVEQDAYASAWNAASYSGSLFELHMTEGQDGDATNTNESLTSLTSLDPTGATTFNFQVIPSQDVLSLFADDDVRSSLIQQTPGGVTFFAKYGNTRGAFTDRVPIVRVAEMYLIRAEARVEQDNASGAREDLNTLRTTRGLSEVGGPDSGLIDSIMVERRRELLYEGHRWYDLKRRGMDVPKPQPTVTEDEIPYSDFRILAPLPDAEVRSSPELEQNPGY